MEKSRKIDFLAKKNVDILTEHNSVNAKAARSNFSRLINSARIEKETIVITDHGEPAAAIIPISDLRILDKLMRMNWINKISDAEFSQLNLSELRNLIIQENENRAGNVKWAGEEDVSSEEAAE